jgi:uncharacterized coiled-coil protein SlyX
MEAENNAALLARIDALEAKIQAQEKTISDIGVILVETQLTGFATWAALNGVLKAVGWHPLIAFEVDQSLEHSAAVLHEFDPLQAELDTYDLKVTGIRHAMAKSRAMAMAARQDPD